MAGARGPRVRVPHRGRPGSSSHGAPARPHPGGNQAGPSGRTGHAAAPHELGQAGQWRARGGRGLEFHIEADRSLHHWVRMLAGTMVDIGLHRRDAADMARLLTSPDNQDTSPPAPAEGLFSVRATYPATAYDTSPPREPHDALRDA